ncbi:ent-kaur-16-ene synthase, chloroplastic isoform X1 [Iris pallida]|uniref:Ent-kaur-16-ene synthase, chloroplastic isoform X1 n=1 Tax=Iris pallida TaxID=29817 RepID=A0AAX6EMV8_IRIPA|nr:ent-kaur-16-ene synthase, chloroplastic isoform X1 [Iris pallida]
MEEPKHAASSHSDNKISNDTTSISASSSSPHSPSPAAFFSPSEHRRPPHLPPLPSPRSHRLVFFFFFIFLFLFKSFFLVLFKSEEER